MAILELTTEMECGVAAPISAAIPGDVRLPDGPLALQDEAGRDVAPAQRDGNRLIGLLQGWPAGQKLRFRVGKGQADRGVALRREGDHGLSVVLPEGLLTTYVTDPAIARPFFFPLLGPGGRSVTRAYPMRQDVGGETKDHPHHRSFWTAYGEVNDVDDWSEAPGKHGWIRHQRYEDRAEGVLFAGFTARSLWTSHDGRPVLADRRRLRVYNAGQEVRLLDYEVSLIADHGPVRYGDTKEGGILAIRVATSMDGNKGGLMENSLGESGEKGCWGKRAAWLDYSGPVGDTVLGIAMMDHPGNPNHPCYWHARDYGLVGTNPFARKAFEGSGEPSDARQKAGETLRFRYRMMLHRGGARQGHVDQAYHAWIQPPRARLLP